MSSTDQCASQSEPTETEKTRAVGEVTVQALVLAEWTVEVEVDATLDDDARTEAAKRAVMQTRAVEEWDIMTLSFARSLKRHLLFPGHAKSLVVRTKIADQDPELLVNSERKTGDV